MVAKEFTLDEAFEAFNLTYNTVVSKAKQHFLGYRWFAGDKEFRANAVYSPSSY